jgi:hypothetical protein
MASPYGGVVFENGLADAALEALDISDDAGGIFGLLR